MLYIKVENGQTIDHPVFETNLLEVFGKVPDNYEPFTRTEKPALGHYEVDDPVATQYVKVNGVWTDVWPTRQMNFVEKAERRLELLQSCELYRQAMLKTAEDDMQKMSSLEVKEALWGFIQQIKNLEIVDPLNPNFPDYPVTPSGKLMGARGDTSLPGSAPSVIG